MIRDRAARRNLDLTSTRLPPSLVAYIQHNDPIAALSNPPIRNVNPFLHKKVLAIAGGRDDLVPWKFSEGFFERMDVGPHGVKECFVDDDAGHEWTEKMGDKVAHFIELHCLL